MDLAAYRAEAEAFLSALDREHYLHFSGRKQGYEIEPIYDRHAGLFSREVVEELREEPRSLQLLEFAVHGLLGRATRSEEAELARREAALELELNGERIPYRESLVVQANEVEADRRAAIERARHSVLRAELEPLLRELLERSHALTAELGWPSMLAMCEELSGIELRGLVRQTEAFLRATEPDYEGIVEPALFEQLGLGFDRLRRADLAAFFRAPSLDRHFPKERLLGSLSDTLAGMGIALERQPGVVLDTEQRPRKSPRAFCAPVRVPGEIYLVIARIGGRDDYAALFHEAGHTEHYAHVERSLPVEHRYLGDNSITEGFAFLFEHLLHDREWLRRRLGIAQGDADRVVAHARAVKLVFLRRYCAKLAYELELHDAPRSLDDLADVYSRRLSDAVHVDWPSATWLSDVDAFFYAARYLRAWALETHLRQALRARFGSGWFDSEEAGDFLREMWSQGQRLTAEDLLATLAGAPLDFSVLVEELGLAD